MVPLPVAIRIVCITTLVVLSLALLDRVRRGREATRWRALPAIVIGWCGGAVLGVAIDRITVSIAPAYFAIGKQLGGEPGLVGRALLLGAAAGAGAGLCFGMAIGRHPAPIAVHLRQAGWTAVLVAAGLGLGLAIGRAVEPPERAPWAQGVTTVRWGHTGVYVAGLVGTLAACRARGRSARRAR
jgi:hypothetical protein